MAAEAVTRIAALYRIEKQIKGRPPDERRAVRSSQARPLFDDLRRWLKGEPIREWIFADNPLTE